MKASYKRYGAFPAKVHHIAQPAENKLYQLFSSKTRRRFVNIDSLTSWQPQQV
jgi:hypothetical protein